MVKRKFGISTVILLLTISVSAQVPDNFSFGQDTVRDYLWQQQGITSDFLDGLFSVAKFEKFDPHYEGYHDRLSNFRNYDGDFYRIICNQDSISGWCYNVNDNWSYATADLKSNDYGRYDNQGYFNISVDSNHLNLDQYLIERAFYSYDLTNISSSATIDSAVFYFSRYNDTEWDSPTLRIILGSFDYDEEMDNYRFQQFYTDYDSVISNQTELVELNDNDFKIVVENLAGITNIENHFGGHLNIALITQFDWLELMQGWDSPSKRRGTATYTKTYSNNEI